MKQYYPKKMTKHCYCCGQTGTKYYYAWQCAYASGPALHYILPYSLWEMLSGYAEKDTTGLFKYYKTYNNAINALKNALKLLDHHVNEYSNIKENDGN